MSWLLLSVHFALLPLLHVVHGHPLTDYPVALGGSLLSVSLLIQCWLVAGLLGWGGTFKFKALLKANLNLPISGDAKVNLENGMPLSFRAHKTALGTLGNFDPQKVSRHF